MVKDSPVQSSAQSDPRLTWNHVVHYSQMYCKEKRDVQIKTQKSGEGNPQKLEINVHTAVASQLATDRIFIA